MWTQNLIVLHEYGEKDVLLTICLEVVVPTAVMTIIKATKANYTLCS